MGHFYTFTEWGYFWGFAKISNIFVGLPDIPDIFFGLTVDASWSKHTYEEKMRVPHPL